MRIRTSLILAAGYTLLSSSVVLAEPTPYPDRLYSEQTLAYATLPQISVNPQLDAPSLHAHPGKDDVAQNFERQQSAQLTADQRAQLMWLNGGI